MNTRIKLLNLYDFLMSNFLKHKSVRTMEGQISGYMKNNFFLN